ncbi:MAG: hypothetical protein II580_00995, partial [Bacteroidales bacterium]|nr:hypothetical protein [Bacteroidales bacterium]
NVLNGSLPKRNPSPHIVSMIILICKDNIRYALFPNKIAKKQSFHLMRQPSHGLIGGRWRLKRCYVVSYAILPTLWQVGQDYVSC